MSISMKKYVDIKSRVGATGGVPRRELILRLFTKNELVSPASPLEFTTAKAVGTLFGLDSEEYLRAKQYFSYVSPNFNSPRKISFGSDAQSKGAPQVIGTTPKSVADIQAAAVSDGNSFGISYREQGGGFNSYNVSNVDVSKATTYAAIATILQTAIRARFSTSSYSSLKNATVAYDSSRGVFTFTGASGEAISVQFSTLPWAFTKALGLWSDFSDGTGATNIAGTASASTSPATSVEESAAASNNFGTFSFMRTLTLSDHIAIAEANAERNVTFEYVVPVTLANYEAWSAALLGYEGTTLVLVSDTNTEYDEQIPGAIKAAVDYSKNDSVVSYMYREMDGITAKCSDDTLSDALDKARVNYYGETQQAGTQMSFYQRGVMMGGDDSPVDENVFANEQWLKDDLAAGFLELFLSVGRVSTNSAGKNKLTNTVQASLDQAVANGTVSVGKELSTKQKSYISQISGDDRAWIQVQNIGYWYTVGVEAYTTEDGRTEYKGVYTLLYSKDDTIRKVEGNNILI